ncbi:alpha/beta hydrolase [Sphingomonas sp. 35-24ZXX]|uniref:alpha/beta hydrolase n=1 Tax=Sphingomonas sp. 35-24ZXX TaxID=1545915 RepID=UPI00068DED66|nr:alpha/beta hydrolase [Sphingomonas sp. 35-24ZXX]
MIRPHIRDDAQAYLDALAKQPRPPMNDQTIAMIRNIPPEQLAVMMSMSELPVPELAVDRKLTMPGPAGPIELRMFDPRATREPGPVVVFYHGGGFIVGSIATHASFAAEIARQLDMPVVSVEYRLAPENKWPAAPDDAEAAARWVAQNGAALGREVTGLVLSGDSAGGTLTLSTALALRDKPAAVPVRLALAFYPMADGSRTYPSVAQFGDGYGLNTADTAYYNEAFAPDVNSPRHSALLADLVDFPPTVLATASLDPLRDGGRAFASKLAEAGVPVSFYEAEGNIHGFATFRKAIPSAQDDLRHILDLAKAMLAAGPASR